MIRAAMLLTQLVFWNFSRTDAKILGGKNRYAQLSIAPVCASTAIQLFVTKLQNFFYQSQEQSLPRLHNLGIRGNMLESFQHSKGLKSAPAGLGGLEPASRGLLKCQR